MLKMKVIITLWIMIWSVLWVFLYYCLFSLFLKDDEKYLTIPYWSMFWWLIIVLVMAFLEIYNSL